MASTQLEGARGSRDFHPLFIKLGCSAQFSISCNTRCDRRPASWFQS